MSDWRTGHPKEVVQVLLQAVQLQSHRRPRSTKRPSSNRQRQLPPPHPSWRRGISGEIAQEGEVSRSGQRPSGADADRGRSHYKCPTDYMQQDLADSGVAHAVDPISHHHPPQERQPTAIPELSSASSATRAKLCWKSCWTDWSRKRKRSSLRNKQASDQDAAQQSRSATLGYCARSTSNTNKTSITSSLTSRRRSTGYGMQHYGPPWGISTSTPTWSEWYRTSMRRPPAQSTLITA